MAKSIEQILRYGELSDASYIDITAGTSDPDIQGLLQRDRQFSVPQSIDFTTQYEVMASSSEYGIGSLSGFDATLFKDKNTGEVILSFRGSSSPLDWMADAALGVSGITFSQQISMINFYEKLIDENVISSTTNLTVTGHSLGGFLAQLFTGRYESIVDHAYTYNAPGVGGAMAEVLDGLGVPVNVPSSKITNIYAEEGWEMTSGAGAMNGEIIPVSIDAEFGDVLHNHSISTLTKSLYAYSIFSQINGSDDLPLFTEILAASEDKRILEIINDIFQAGVNIEQDHIVDIALDLKTAISGTFAVTSLVGESASSLASQARNDEAVLFSINELADFKIAGNQPGYTYDPDDFTDQHLEDRAKFLYYLALTEEDKLWICEKSLGEARYTSAIEQQLERGHEARLSNINRQLINTNFDNLIEANLQRFMVQAYFAEAFTGAFYSLNFNKFIVTDKALLEQSIAVASVT